MPNNQKLYSIQSKCFYLFSVQWNINHLDNNQLYGGAMWRWKNPSIRDGPYGGKTHTHAYYLWQLHFHWGEPGMTDKGSEHTVDGKMYPMEMHMVHVEDNFIGKKGYVKVSEAIESPHGLAVFTKAGHGIIKNL